jgi:cytochrome P450
VSLASFGPRSREYLLDPQRVAQALLEEAPVFYCERANGWFVLRYAEARRAYDDFETYSSRTRMGLPLRPDLRGRIPEEWERVAQVIHGSQVSNLDPPVHTSQRRALQRTFTPKRVAAARPNIATIANELVDGLADRGECDIVQEFGMQLTVRVVGTMLGLPRDMIPGFLAWIGDVFRVLAPKGLKPEEVTTPDDELVAIYERLHSAYLTYAGLLEQRRASPGEDLPSAMLALTDVDGRPALTTDQVLAHMLGLTAAGTDTTAGLITSMVRFFTESPDQLRLVLDDPRLWDNAVQEGLRRSAVALHSLRVSTRDSELAGVEIPAKSMVWIGLAGANADPSVFPDPLRFDVRRANASEHLAFGHGRHYCLGAPLAPPEARIALEALYARLPGLQADLDQEPEFLPSPLARVLLSQRVSWQPA